MNYLQLCILFYFKIQHFPTGICAYSVLPQIESIQWVLAKSKLDY